jgi:hypothetical protein
MVFLQCVNVTILVNPVYPPQHGTSRAFMLWMAERGNWLSGQMSKK